MKVRNAFFSVFSIIVCSLFAFIPTFSPAIVNADVEGISGINLEILNSNTKYNLISEPNHITSVNNLDFYLTDENGVIYFYSPEEGLVLETSAFSSLVDMCYFNNALYIITETDLIKYAVSTKTPTVIDSTLSNLKAVTANEEGIYVASQTEIMFFDFRNLESAILSNSFEFNSSSFNFEGILDIALNEDNSLSLVHTSSLGTLKTYVVLSSLKLDSTFTSLTHNFSKKISSTSNTDIQIQAFANSLFVSQDDKIYSTPYNDAEITDIFSEPPLIETTFTQISFKTGELLSVSSFCISGNKILICDSISNSVQSFKIDLESSKPLSSDKLLIATSGADEDRLYLPNNISLNHNDFLYVLDVGNHRIIENNLQNGKSSSIMNIPSPLLMETNSFGSLYVVSKPGTEQILTIINKSNSNKITKALTDYQISDITITTNNDVYFLDATNKKIYSLNQENNELIELISLTSLSLDLSATIKANASGNKLYLFANNSIYSIDLTKSIPVCDNEISLISGTIIDFNVDYKNNVYLLVSESGNNNLIKYSPLGIKLSTKTLPESNYSNANLDLVNGKIYFINPTYHRVEVLTIDNFVDVLNDFINDTSFKTEPPTTGANIAKIKENCQSFKHPFSVQPLITLNKDDLIIVLNEETSENSNFAYVMIANKEMRNILAYVQVKNLDFDLTEPELNFNKIMVNLPAIIYYLPTGLQFEGEATTCKLFQVKPRDVYEVLGTAFGYTDYSKISFYEIKLEDDTIGYIKAPYAHNPDDAKNPKITLQSDARIEKILVSDIVYVYQYDEELKEYVKTSVTLENGQLIQLLDRYDADLQFLKIKYPDANDSTLKTGFVETKFVVYEDITWLKIVGIIVLIVGVILLAIAGTMIGNYIKRQTVLKADYENNIPNKD